MMKYRSLLSLVLTLPLLIISCDKEPLSEPDQDVNTEQPEPEPKPEVPDNNVYFTATAFDGMHMASVSSDLDAYMVFFSNDDYTISYGLVLSNILGEIDDESYVTVPSGTYTLGDGVTAFTIADYSYYVVSSSDGSDYNSFSFDEATLVVSETQSILTAVIEGVTHIMTYNGPLRMEADLPAPPVSFEASCAYAYYTAGIYKLYLSDLGLDADGNEQANGTYYEFSILVDSSAPKAENSIPAGTYEIDGLNSEPGTISGGDYYKYGASANEIIDSDLIWGGHLIINEDGKIEAECTMLLSGSTHTVTYSGDIEILASTIPTEPPYSTLTADKVCDFSNHGIMGTDRGDAYNTGYQTFAISLSGNDGMGDHVMFELLAGEVGSSDIYGKYTVSDSMEAYTVLPGYVKGFTLMSSWYYYKQNAANVTEYAPVVSGWVEIIKNDDDTVTVEFDVYDDLNNNITGSWTSSL